MVMQLTLTKEKVTLISPKVSYFEFANLIKQIIKNPNEKIFEIDFSHVDYINNSGTKNFIINLIESFQNLTNEENFYSFYLSNLSEEYEHKYNIEAVLIHEKVAVIIKEQKRPKVIGYSPKITQDILNILADTQEEMSSKEITIKYNIKHKEQTEKSVNSIGTQLNKLYHAGLVKRVYHTSNTGGRNYVYSSLF